MNAFEANKMIGALLMAVLVSLVIGHLSEAIVAPARLAHPVFLPEGQGEAAASQAAAPEPAGAVEPIAALLAAANVEAGKTVFKQCAGCHNVDKGGRSGVGPNLWDVVGSKKGRVAGFGYSPALQGEGQKAGDAGQWSYEQLNQFLANPKAAVPGTKMPFAGLRKADERASVIAYLRSLSDAPKPLP